MNKRETHIVTGMTRDLATSRFEPNFVYDAHNIRVRTVNGDSTLLSVTNEKGTEEFSLTENSANIVGTILGTATFSDTLVLFTKDFETGLEYIYKVEFNTEFTEATCSTLFAGVTPDVLNLQKEHPLETLALYENENIKKVYWVDGVNQPRVINISTDTPYTNPDIFNFNREIGTDAVMEVIKYNSGGEFRPGTIQYCFNYYNKFGQETNIVDVSSLYYISPKDSGLAADDISNCSFQITFKNLNTNFEYIRLYAIYRSSENATPSVRIIGDYSTASSSVTIYHPSDTFTEILTPQWQDGVEIPFENLWVVDSNMNKIKNVHETLAASNQSGPEYIVSLNNGQYFLDDRINTAYYIKVTRAPYIQAAALYNDGTTQTYFLYTNSGSRILMGGSFIPESVNKNISVVDTGTYGSTIDATALLFIGGQYIVAETLADKDNTLFLGNLRNVVPNLGTIKVRIHDQDIYVKDIKGLVDGTDYISVESCLYDYSNNILTQDSPYEDVEVYQRNNVSESTVSLQEKDNNRDSRSIKTFKARENYRLGFIGQYKTGQWSEVIWAGDFTEELSSGVHHFFENSAAGTSGLLLWGKQFRSSGFKSTIDSSVVDSLLNNGFIKIAPVVVYPNMADRYVICQGLLCPTVFCSKDRNENAPYTQCDWRFRKGYNWNRIKDEIQSNVVGEAAASEYAPEVPFAHYQDNGTWKDLASDKFDKFFPTEYYSDPSILSFHSPDIDSSEELYADDFTNLNLRLVGFSNNGFVTYLDERDNTYYTKERSNPDTQTHTFVSMGTLGFGDKSSITIANNTYETNLNYSLAMKGFYDNLVEEGTDSDNKPILTYKGSRQGTPDTNYYMYYTYLWHRNGSLNNQNAMSIALSNTGAVRTAMYNRKVFSQKTFGYTTYLNNVYDFLTKSPIEVPTLDIKLSDMDDSPVVFFNTPQQENRLYYGNVDKVIVNGLEDLSTTSFYDAVVGDTGNPKTGVDYSDGYTILYTTAKINEGQVRRVPGTPNYNLRTGRDPVSIKYKTTRHAVISLRGIDDTHIGELGVDDLSTQYVYWTNSQLSFNGYYIPNDEYLILANDEVLDYSFADNCLYIGELYREMTDEQVLSRFGGNSQEALAANVWTLAGETVKLISGQDAILYFTEGDTYFGRYDCLKSYPASQEDKQSIVSIYSTEIESRVNLDFRYGTTMNLDDNTMVTPQNFNLYNHSGYEQTNQYFTYKAIDYDRYLDQHFPNMITWSLEKTLGEDVDKWTSIPLTSTLDLDGTKGEITKVVRFNNEIFAFQESAFAQVLFNSRVQIPVSDGQPIEITNGYKVDGKRYISESIGMYNKWSLGVTPYGLYFIDDHKNSIFAYNGQLVDLTNSKGMKSWMYDEGNRRRDRWNPIDYSNVRTFYDRIYGELYFTTKNDSLVYSETLGNFISFMDYGGLQGLDNVGNKLFAIPDSSHSCRLWDMWAGKYNTFFGEFKPYWMTFIANADPMNDKVFNNLEWRSVAYDESGCYLPYSTFDTMRVWHEHQDTGCTPIRDDIGIPSLLKKKFNAFRTFIPRDMRGLWSLPGLDRIRNPWAYVRLAKTQENTDQMIFTDLNIDFFE